MGVPPRTAPGPQERGAKLTAEEEEILNKKRSKEVQKNHDERKKDAKISRLVGEQLRQGKLLRAWLQEQASVAEQRDVLEARSWSSIGGKSRPGKANKSSSSTRVIKLFGVLCPSPKRKVLDSTFKFLNHLETMFVYGVP